MRYIEYGACTYRRSWGEAVAAAVGAALLIAMGVLVAFFILGLALFVLPIILIWLAVRNWQDRRHWHWR